MVLGRIFTPRTLSAIAALVAFCGMVAGCSPHVEPLARPTRVESFCPTHPVHEYPKTTSMGSIMTSVYDSLPTGSNVPTLAKYRADLRTSEGAIEYYDRLRLLKPGLAKQLGSSDDYVVAREVIFNNDIVSDSERYIYMEVLDHGVYRWQALRAPDIQNVCSQGQRLM
ncbi:MAG: hypothetical protein ABSE64_05325 [Vulcanimicrobiaceae bacterium]